MANVSAYNTPRVLGNVFNTVSYYGVVGYTPGTPYNPSETISTPKTQTVKAGTLTIAANVHDSKMKLYVVNNALTIELSDVAFNDNLTTTATITTSTAAGLSGHTFNYSFSVFTIGVGLPYISGDHAYVYRVGEYVRLDVAPNSHEHRRGSLNFDVFGDVVPGQNNHFSIQVGDAFSGLTITKQADSGNPEERQSLKIRGRAQQPGIFRVTLAMESTAGTTGPSDPVDIPGSRDNESFLLYIRPRGPQPDDLFVIRSNSVVPADVVYRLSAVGSPAKNLANNSFVQYISDALFNSADNRDVGKFTYHDAVWDEPPLNEDDAWFSGYTHARGYLSLDLSYTVDTTEAAVHLVLSHDEDKWRMYMWASNILEVHWVAVAEAPLRASSDKDLIPLYLQAVNLTGDQYIDFYLKGDQRFYVDTYGSFSTAGTVGGVTYYTQEPLYVGWPSILSAPTAGTLGNKLLRYATADDQWLLLNTVGDSTPVPVAATAVNAVALPYCPPRPNQNHGDVTSTDVVWQVPEYNEALDTYTYDPNTSISNYEHVSQLDTSVDDSKINGQDCTWVLSQCTRGNKVAGYMWTNYYPLIRFINFATTKLLTSGSGSVAVTYTSSDTQITSSIKGQTGFPDNVAAYENGSGGYYNLSYEKKEGTVTALVSSSISWKPSNSNSFFAWTGYVGCFKMAGWSPSIANGAMTVSEDTQRTAETSTGQTTHKLVELLWEATDAKEKLTGDKGQLASTCTGWRQVTCGNGGIPGNRWIPAEFSETWNPLGAKGTSQWVVNEIITHNATITGGGGDYTVIYHYPEGDEAYPPETFDGTITYNDGTWSVYPDDFGIVVDCVPYPVNNLDSFKLTLGYDPCGSARYVGSDTGCGELIVNIDKPRYSCLVPGGEGEPSYEGDYSYDINAHVSIQSTTQEVQSTTRASDLSTNPFPGWVTHTMSGGTLTIAPGAAFPVAPGDSPPSSVVVVAQPGDQTLTGIVQWPAYDTINASTNLFTASYTYKRELLTSGGGFLVESAVTDSGGALKGLLIWPQNYTTETILTHQSGQGAATLSPSTAADKRWFAANAVVLDGPPRTASEIYTGTRSIYMAPCGHGSAQVGGGGTYILEVVADEKTTTTINYQLNSTTNTPQFPGRLCYYLTITTDLNIDSTGLTDEEKSFSGDHGLGFDCRCGLIVANNVVSGAGITGVGSSGYDSQYYSAFAELTGGQTGATQTNVADGNASVWVASDTHAGLNGEHGSTGTSGGWYTVNGVTTSNVGIAGVKTAVSSIPTTMQITGGWVAGAASGGAYTYESSYISSSHEYNTKLRVGLLFNS